MSQNILTAPLVNLRQAVPAIKSPKIVDLIRNIYAEKWDLRAKFGENIPTELILDLERRETILQKELVRRGYLTAEEWTDYRAMLNKQFTRRSF